MTKRGWFNVGWSSFVAFAWDALGTGAGEDCSENPFLCWDDGDVLRMLALPALVLWAAGLFVIWMFFRDKRRL